MRRGVWGYASILLVVPNAAPDTNICPPPFPTHQIRRHLPTQDWQVDFTHMPPIKRVKFLLVFVDTFSGWLKTFLTTNKRAPTVARLILTEILPRFGMPSSLQSDNGPEFTSQITQNIARALQVPWRFHIPYHPWSSGKVERANQVLKETLTKLTIKLHQDWTKLLPLAFLKVWALPKKSLNISPFEAMYGRPIVPLGLPPSQDGPSLPSYLPFPLLAQIPDALWQHMDKLLPWPHPNLP